MEELSFTSAEVAVVAVTTGMMTSILWLIYHLRVLRKMKRDELSRELVRRGFK